MPGEQVIPAAETPPAGGEAEFTEELPPRRRSESTNPDAHEANGEEAGGEEGGEHDAAAAEEAEGEAEKAAAPKKYKIKDAEYEENDLLEALEVRTKRKEHLKAANKRFEDASKLLKDEVEPVRALLAAMKKDPMVLFEIARRAGVNPEEAVTLFATDYEKRSKLTPEQRAAEDRMTTLAQKEQEIATREQAVEQARVEREAEGYRQVFAKSVSAVLPKFGLPDDPVVVGEIGRIVAAQLRSGMEEPDYEAAAEIEADRLDSLVSLHLDRLSRTPGALLKKYPELAKKLREEDLTNARAPRTIVPKKAPDGKPRLAPPPKPETKTWAEEEAEMRKRRYGITT